MPAGTYYVTASAEVFVAMADFAGVCWISNASSSQTPIQSSGLYSSSGRAFEAVEMAEVTVTQGTSLEQWCQVGGNNNGSAARAPAIMAIRILSSSHFGLHGLKNP